RPVTISIHHRAQGANGNQPSAIRRTGCKQAGPALHVLHVGTQNVAAGFRRAPFDLWRRFVSPDYSHSLSPAASRHALVRDVYAASARPVCVSKQRRWEVLKARPIRSPFPAEICAGPITQILRPLASVQVMTVSAPVCSTSATVAVK